MKDTICVAVGLVGGFFTAIFGGWDSALVTLVVFMAIDFFTGIITAMMKKSKHAEWGGELRKHFSKERCSQTAMPFFAVFELYFGLFLSPVQNQMHR